MKERSTVTDLLIQYLQGNAQMVEKYLTTLCVAQGHLWLVQSKLHDKETVPFLGVPISPGQTFGPAAAHILQVSKEDRQAQMELQRLIPKPRMHQPAYHDSRPRAPTEMPRSKAQTHAPHAEEWRNSQCEEV